MVYFKRVPGCDRRLEVAADVTTATRRQLDDSFPLRRLGKVRVVNIPDPVEAVRGGISPCSDAAWTTLCRRLVPRKVCGNSRPASCRRTPAAQLGRLPGRRARRQTVPDPALAGCER